VRQEAVKVLAGLNQDAVRVALLAAARQDEKSFVRREAITALGNFATDEVRQALRKTIAEDQSYYAAADALRTLVKIDRAHCAADLLAALERPSHHEVVLRAAVDGLIDLKETQALQPLQKKLDGKLRPEERVAVLGALARLKPEDDQSLQLVKRELDNDRNHVRRVAIDTLVALGTPQAIEWLQTQRNREPHQGTVRAIDEALEKLRQNEKPLSEVKKEVERLREANRKLEERLKKLEGK
jgi:HEAT repeat protein